MAEEFRIVFVNDATPDTGGGGGGAPGLGLMGLAGITTAVGALAGIGGEILSLVSEAVGGVLKPLRNFLVASLKMVASLLQPIVDVVILTLQPVFSLLKPLIGLFRTMMAPFLDISRQFGALSREQAEAGDIGGAMASATKGVMALIGPFVVAVGSVFVQMASSVFITGLAQILGLIFPPFAGMLQAKALEFTNGIATITNTVAFSLLDGMQTMAEQGLAEAQAAWEAVKLQTDAVVASNQQYNEALGICVDTNAQAFTSLSFLSSQTQSVMGTNGKVPTNFNSGLSQMERSLVSWAGQVNNVIKSLNVPEKKKETKKLSLSERIFGVRRV